MRVIEPYRDALAHRIVGEVDDLRGGGIEPHGQKNAGRGGRALRQRERKDLPLAPALSTQTSADIPVVGDEIKTGLVVAVKTRLALVLAIHGKDME